MKIAFDVDVLAKQMSINDYVHKVADWGYKYIEQSPHPRINPFYKHPLFSKECEEEYRRALRETGVEISSFIVVYRWSGPTEEQRQHAVANWKRMIEIAVILLREPISLWKLIGLLAITGGTLLMIQKKEKTTESIGVSWLIYAVLSAVFASLTAIFGKIGITGVESNLGTALRTGVVLLMAWLVVFVKGKQTAVRQVPGKELIFIVLSGIATGASWLCYYKALQDGLASVVVPIDKLSILVTIAFSYVVFQETLSKRAGIGLLCVVVGTLLML